MQQKQIIKFIKPLIILLMAGYLVYHFYSAYYYIAEIDSSQLSLKTLKGEDVNADTLLNKKSIIVFFQTWCASCIHEMKLVNAHSTDFDFIDIYFVTDEPIEKVQHLIKKFQLNNINVLLSNQSMEDMRITAFPTSYMYKNGICIEKHKGMWIDESNYEDEMYHLRMIFH